MRIRLIVPFILAAAFSSVASGSPYAQGSFFMPGSSLEDRFDKCILQVDNDSLAVNPVYSSDRYYCYVFPDSSGRCLAWEDYDGRLGVADRIVVYDLHTHTPTVIAEGVSVCDRQNPWSPDASMLAFLTCKVTPSPYPPEVTGVWVYSVRTGTREKIRDNALCAGWLINDGRLYVQVSDGGPVIAYDVVTKQFSDTPFHGVDFSPDGKYYCTSQGVMRVFSTVTNENLWSSRVKKWDGYYRDWHGSHFICLLPGPPWPHDALLDCETGIVREVPEQVIAVVDDGKTVIFGGRVTKTLQKKALADLPILAPADDTQSETTATEEALKNAEPAAPAKPETKPQP